jgi:hypothetical protein
MIEQGKDRRPAAPVKGLFGRNECAQNAQMENVRFAAYLSIFVEVCRLGSFSAVVRAARQIVTSGVLAPPTISSSGIRWGGLNGWAMTQRSWMGRGAVNSKLDRDYPALVDESGVSYSRVISTVRDTTR